MADIHDHKRFFEVKSAIDHLHIILPENRTSLSCLVTCGDVEILVLVPNAKEKDNVKW